MTTIHSRRQFMGLAAAGLAAATFRPPSAAGASPAGGARPAATFGFALNTATIRGQKLPLPEQVETAAKAGYDGLEPWIGDIQAFVDDGGSAADLGKRCRDLNLKVVSAIGFANWVVDDDAQRAKGVEQMKRDMDLVARIGGTRIAAPPAGATKPEPKLDLDRAAERYRVILEAGRSVGVIPQIEFWGASPNLGRLAEAIYVAAQSGHPDAGVLADAYHMYKGGSPFAALGLLGRGVMQVFHLNDYPAAPPRESIKDSDRVFPGDGVAPLKEILALLARPGGPVMLSLEVFNAEYWKLPALEAARTGLEKMKAVAKSAGLGD